MKKLLLLTMASACVPPGGSWGNWGSAGGGGGGGGGGSGDGGHFGGAAGLGLLLPMLTLGLLRRRWRPAARQ